MLYNTRIEAFSMRSYFQISNPTFVKKTSDHIYFLLMKVNFSDICLPDIYTHLFGMLCVALELDTSDSDRLSAKLGKLK